jgi:AraC-like DNA-binding protein
MTVGDYNTLRLLTDPIPVRDRFEMTREVFGRTILNLNLEPDPDMALGVDFDMRSVPGLKLVAGSATGVISARTKALLVDSNDDLFLSINDTNVFHVAQRDRAISLAAGDAFLITCAEPASFRRSHGHATGLRVPRAAFAHILPAVEDRVGLFIHSGNEALRLLRSYVRNVLDDHTLAEPHLRYLAVTHIYDLLALVLDVRGDARHQAGNRGLKAAQLQTIKDQVKQRLASADLSITTVAADNRLSERYIQRLFEADGATFSVFVSHLRLGRAYRQVRDPRHLYRTISEIAYDCGFGNISHFNRAFLRLYGVTPSEARRDRDDRERH